MENARKEGGVTLYAATNMRDTQEIVAGFNKFYPFVKVGITSLGGPGVLNEVTTEERAGVAVAEVVTTTGGYVPELIEKKIWLNIAARWCHSCARDLSMRKVIGQAFTLSATRLFTTVSVYRRKMRPSDTKICSSRAGKITC